MTSLRTVFDLVRHPAPLNGPDIASMYEMIGARGGQVMLDTYTDLVDALNLPDDHPMAAAGKDIAALIDTDPHYGGHANNYHNARHMLDVTLSCAMLLAAHDRNGFSPVLSASDKLALLTVALSHDIGHNGVGNGWNEKRVPLLTETHSLELCLPVIANRYRENGRDDAQDITVFSALLSATDIRGGEAAPGKIFTEMARFHRGEIADMPAAKSPEQEKFHALLAASPLLCEMACLLQDADLFSSVALTPEWAEQQERNLGGEEPHVYRTPDGQINWKGSVYFHTNLAVPKSLAGRLYVSNHDPILSHVQDRAAVQDALKIP